MRKGVAPVVAAFALSAVAGASATESTIYPGVGIGKVKLGMTLAQVERGLGTDFLVNQRATVGGVEYVAYGWNFSTWGVLFRKSGRTYRALVVSTMLPTQRTAAGIGPGTSWLKVVHTYPGGRCTFGDALNPLPHAIGDRLEYMVTSRTGTQTIYSFRGVADKSNPTKTVNNLVIEVHVRTPFAPLPEFAANYPYRCASGWDKAAAPHHVP